jgi:mannose-1-phosphate guanylyltransferase/phosphomannomutase
MKAIVLAGGFGTRIQPLTNSLPKPMLPVMNVPMMEHIIKKLRDELKIKEIAVLLYFKPEIIKNHFGDGSAMGVKLTYVEPDDDYGTAGAVGFTRDLMDERFIIVSGDLVTDFDLKEVESFHVSKNAKLSIVLTRVENPLQFGVVITNAEGKIEKFLEKPGWGEVFSDTINTGIYLLEPEVFDYIPKNEEFDFAKDLFPTLMREGIDLWGCNVEGFWRDVGNPQSYKDVHKELFNGDVRFEFEGDKLEFDEGELYYKNSFAPPKNLQVIGTVVIDEGVKIGDDVVLQDSVIGKNSMIKSGAKIKNSVIWNDVLIASKVNLNGAVICNNTTVTKKTKAKNGVIISEHCDIDEEVTFAKDVIVWPNKTINAHAVVSSNVIWGKDYKSSLFESGKVIGRTNIELSCEMATKLAESYGSILPVGAKIYMSRDYHKSSRMLKRAFLSGMLSTGINVIDLQNVPSNVMRHILATNDEIIGGVHFRQSVINQLDTEINFFTKEGMSIDNNVAKSIERIFFRENFRRVKNMQIGDIFEQSDVNSRYVDNILQTLDMPLFKNSEIKVAVDVMFGSTATVYPKVLNELQVENIVMNAYMDDKKLSKIPSNIKESGQNIAKIVQAMGYDCGFLLYPNGQKLQLVSDKGEVVYDYVLLLLTLAMLDSLNDKKYKIFLPAWGPDFISYKNLEITRGKIENLKADELKEYDLIATTDGHLSFTEFGLNHDALFATLKLLELNLKTGKNFSTLLNEIETFCFKGRNIACPSSKKGFMMRKFLELAKDKEHSLADGVKIYTGKNEWILMVPSQYDECLHIYMQAASEERADEIFSQYHDLIVST